MNEYSEYLKAKIKNVSLSFFRSYKANLPQHLSDEEFETLTNFSKNNLKESLLIKRDKSILNKKNFRLIWWCLI